MQNKIIDISLPVYTGMPVYPNNPQVIIEPIKTATSFISKITLGSHTGTHLDAPRHISEDGLSIDEISLSQIVGPCRVLDMTHCQKAVFLEDIKKENIQEGERILVKTNNSLRGSREFYPDYVYLDGTAAEFLAGQKIVLFGIDSLSIKQKSSPDLRPHAELLNNNIVIIEGLDLSQVNPGRFDLYCLPIKFTGLDGSPARVILVQS